ncbi:hypothetical protein CcI49_18915 [Frankia sp. CcI49]|uniref:TIGR03619 family F420-dependent LLM class oxidoreductase n=1 Tax=unclassified Frankia TaxID=2632575 RepID=UPI0006CA0EF4|nr:MULTISPECIES: TIGR03619 family F420-dependent LLM class oxidoreductase [unclassified Frankia]KPM52098.1 hypothetical protein ACG83_31730 [Frankia sp. R43]ONH58821.1 hypothetical protein CcI49_18915 [Frankia sp. CcI49]
MKFDVILPGTSHLPDMYPWARHLSPPQMRQMLTVLDTLGFANVSVSEHLGMPDAEVGRLGPYWQDALTVLAFIAAATERIRLDTAVLVLPYHHPLRLAKALATIDVLSGGRLGVSVGVGHAEAEFTALGVPFTERGAIADEILAALDALWSSDPPRHQGKRFAIEGLAIEPRPTRKPRPPIRVGGNSRPALRRAARYDGWQPNPVGFEATGIPPLLDYIRAQPDFAGKEQTFDVNWLKPPAGVEPAGGFTAAGPGERRAYRERLLEAYTEQYPALGITRTSVEQPRGVDSLAEYLDFLRWFAAEIIPAVPGRGAE